MSVNRIFTCLCFILTLLVMGNSIASDQVNNIRFAESADKTRIVFDLNQAIKHSVFVLKQPDRVVIDLDDARLNTALGQQLVANIDSVNNIRSSTKNSRDLRIVLDTQQAVQVKSFLLNPEGQQSHRLVVDLTRQKTAVTKALKSIKNHSAVKLRDVVVAIDAGHGGKDPGAIGHGGIREASVTLKIAKSLAQQINGMKGMRAVLVRDRDVFIPLQDRTRIAREHQADLFVSIHADAFHDPRAKGSSVYALSTRGATSEAAKWLADRENKVDLVGGVKLSDKDDLVASVLLDLSQTATIQSSMDVGRAVLSQIGNINRMHKKQVQQAGFMVLKSPDIPSILVETAFISNPGEAKKLGNANYREKMARAISSGIQSYFKRYAPPNTYLSQHYYESLPLSDNNVYGSPAL